MEVFYKTTKNLCPYCGISFSSLGKLKTHVVAEHGTEPLPKPEGVIRLVVNGEDYKLKVEPEWTLYQVIHDTLGLTSVKMFCDRGACGSCTVIMEGRPILSCMTLAIECDGKAIETAEGLQESAHPLLEAYVRHHAMQCGYCTPGFIMTAKSLLDKNTRPNAEQVRQALAGNLCRCGTYPQHLKAVLEASKKLGEKQ
jgi:aerobic-type carbon monoxide dehydrogenase small subunit (CoxS/CutS family)